MTSSIKSSKTAIVISGGPSVGKTTIIESLEKQGHPVMHEISTAMIKEAKFLPWDDRHIYQMELLRRQLAEEERLEAKSGKLCFLDRGLLDGIAYYRMDGLEAPADFDSLDVSHYAVVFLLEPLSEWSDNGVRFENLEFAKQFGPIVEDCYKRKGIPTTWVPQMGVEERLEFILGQIPWYV